MAQYTFEECRRNAYGLLGDAADWIRAGDWPELSPDEQARVNGAVRDVLDHIGQAKAALDRVLG